VYWNIIFKGIEMLMPGKLYKVDLSFIESDKKFKKSKFYDIYTYMDNIPTGDYGELFDGDVLLYCKEAFVPNIILYEFLHHGKSVYYSSYYKEYLDRIFILI
jgi:hypothetical protein